MLERFLKERNRNFWKERLKSWRVQNGTIEKKERERNDLAEGPRSRTERNDFRKVIKWPNLKNLSGGLNLSRGLNMAGST